MSDEMKEAEEILRAAEKLDLTFTAKIVTPGAEAYMARTEEFLVTVVHFGATGYDGVVRRGATLVRMPPEYATRMFKRAKGE